MAQLEDLSSTELLNFIIYDTISASATQNPKLFTNYSTISSSTSLESHSSLDNASTAFMLDHCHSIIKPPRQAEDAGGQFINLGACSSTSPMVSMNSCGMRRQSSVGVVKAEGGGRKKSRRKRARVCKNQEEAETQRMTHITVERNRRKQMNEHLAVLRSLMPDSYVQRGDQASIVEGAIEFVKELEHLLQSLEAQKLQQQGNGDQEDMASSKGKLLEAPFAQFFMYPQYSWSQTPNKYTSKSKGAIADIEVSLIETHANLRILLRRCVNQLSKLVAAFHALHLPILHLTLTTMEPLALYSISAKVEEGSQLSSVDDIAAAVHHMLIVIEAEEATALS